MQGGCATPMRFSWYGHEAGEAVYAVLWRGDRVEWLNGKGSVDSVSGGLCVWGWNGKAGPGVLVWVWVCACYTGVCMIE